MATRDITSHPPVGYVIPFKTPVVYKWGDGWKTVPTKIAEAVFELTETHPSMGGSPASFVCNENKKIVHIPSGTFHITRKHSDGYIHYIKMKNITTGTVRTLNILKSGYCV